MERFPPSGTHSLHLTPDVLQATRDLSLLCEDATVRSVALALGEDPLLCLVGGTVRDVLLGRTNVDLDLATSLPAERASELLSIAGIRVIPTGLKHGTVTALVSDTPLEITSFRAGSGGTLEDDLRARDFTINAIGFSLKGRAIIDPLAGIDDLREGRLRACGNAVDRISEDPLRILRMIRFGPASGRTLDDSLSVAATQLVTRLAGVSVERIRCELDRILTSPYAGEALRSMLALGILAEVLPELLPTVGMIQNDFHIHDVFDHTLAVLDACPPDRILRWSAIFHDIGKVETLSIGKNGERHFYEHERVSGDIALRVMERLKFSHHDMAVIEKLVRLHMRPLDCGAPGVRRLMRELGGEMDRWREFKKADKPPVYEDSQVADLLARFDALRASESERLAKSNGRRISIGGSDLLGIGLKEGKMVGEVLHYLEEMVLDDPTKNSPEVLLELARGFLANRSPRSPE